MAWTLASMASCCGPGSAASAGMAQKTVLRMIIGGSTGLRMMIALPCLAPPTSSRARAVTSVNSSMLARGTTARPSPGSPTTSPAQRCGCSRTARRATRRGPSRTPLPSPRVPTLPRCARRPRASGSPGRVCPVDASPQRMSPQRGGHGSPAPTGQTLSGPPLDGERRREHRGHPRRIPGRRPRCSAVRHVVARLRLRRRSRSRPEPHVDRPWLGGVEGPWPPRRVVLDPAHPEGVLVGQALGTKEVDENGCRLRVAAWPHLDLDAVVDEEVPVPEDVVDRGDLEVHVAQPRLVALEDGELVVDGVDPHEACGIADPVGHPRVEGAGPEPVGLVDVRRVEAQVTELGDPRRTPEGDRPGEELLLCHQLEPVAEGVVERDAGADPARPRGRGVETADREATTFELALRARQGVVVGNGEARRDDPGPTRDEREAMVARVGPKVRDPPLIRGHQLKPHDVGREANGGAQIRGAGTHVGDVLELDHPRPPSARRKLYTVFPGRDKTPGNYRTSRKNERTSLTNSSGCSKAAKWPPLSSSFQ